MDRTALPAGIHEFLRQEQHVLEALLPWFDRLIEVGCMDGRHLDWALAHRKRYVGIDIAHRHIELARRAAIARGLSPLRCQFLPGDAEVIDDLLQPLHEEETRSLIFFPFNVFGAVGDVGRAIAGVRRAGLPFLISSYQTTGEATATRQQYYQRCGYGGLRMERHLHGVSFLTADGFRTTAYEPEYLQALWRAYDVPVIAFIWSTLNVVYVPESFMASADALHAAVDGVGR